MSPVLKVCLVSMFTPVLLAQQRPWQQVTFPSTSEVAANFKAPPREYGAIQPFQSWNGADPAEVRARISRDLDRLSANGVFIINLSPGRRDMAHGEPAYLSPGHMEQVKYTVDELAKRNMRMWIQDESDYPSGFAGGYITERYPQLGMQDIVSDITVHVAPGQTLQMPVPPDTLAIWATVGMVSVGLAPLGLAQAPTKITSVEGITEYRLANGLKVLLFPDESKPTVTVIVTKHIITQTTTAWISIFCSLVTI